MNSPTNITTESAIMASLKNITVSLDYLFQPKLEISACFSAEIVGSDRLNECLEEAIRYNTEDSLIYLFPVYKELAKKYKVDFTTKYNQVISLRRYIYALCIRLGDKLLETKGM